MSSWSISYVHRPPGTKVEYEKEIRKVATFGSVGFFIRSLYSISSPSSISHPNATADLRQIESFFHLYSHLVPPNELPPVTDVLVFLSRIGRPGVWEEMRE